MDLLRNIFKGDKVIWIIFLFLCTISVIEVFSASSTLTYRSGNHWGPITRHALFLMGGAAVVWLFHNIHYKWFQVLPRILLPLAGLFLILLLVFDNLNLGGILVIERTNEASRWVQFCGIPFQPSEFAKMGVIIATAYILSNGQDERGAAPKAFKHILILAGLMCALIMPENYSTAMLLAVVVYLMMFVGRVQLKKLLLLGGGAVAVLAVFIMFLLSTPNEDLKKIPGGGRFTTWKDRIMDFTNHKQVPAAQFDINGGDRQVACARIAVASSNIVGIGPGNSVQRDFLSQAYSDFIYAIIIEELGLVGGAFVLFLYICLLVRVWRIANQCDRTFPAFLVLGIGLLLATQAMFNMMVAVGLAPVTGQPLPLISRGGTSTIINCAYIGILLSVSRYTAALKEQKEREAQALAAAEALPADSLPADSEAQTSEEPHAKALNSDAEFV